VLGSDREDDAVLQQGGRESGRRACAAAAGEGVDVGDAQGGVGEREDSLLVVELFDGGGLVVRVVRNLVDGGQRESGVNELLDLRLVVVGNADRARAARGKYDEHRAPGVETALALVKLGRGGQARRVRRVAFVLATRVDARPVHEEHVDIVRAELALHDLKLLQRVIVAEGQRRTDLVMIERCR
jgi:hypothetical protein